MVQIYSSLSLLWNYWLMRVVDLLPDKALSWKKGQLQWYPRQPVWPVLSQQLWRCHQWPKRQILSLLFEPRALCNSQNQSHQLQLSKTIKSHRHSQSGTISTGQLKSRAADSFVLTASRYIRYKTISSLMIIINLHLGKCWREWKLSLWSFHTNWGFLPWHAIIYLLMGACLSCLLLSYLHIVIPVTIDFL